MYMAYCPNCKKETGYKRSLGFGTLFAVVLTGGLWLVAIYFYPYRVRRLRRHRIHKKTSSTGEQDRRDQGSKY